MREDEEIMAYVILMPHSNTNNSDKYRVVWSEDWARFANGATKAVAIAGEFTTYPEAEKLRDRLNNSIKRREFRQSMEDSGLTPEQAELDAADPDFMAAALEAARILEGDEGSHG